MIALRLNRRRDGSLLLTDANGSPSSPDREFPDPHGFTYDWLANNGAVVSIDGDSLIVELANAMAEYRITERRPEALDVELVSSSLFDAPPVDEAKASADDDPDTMLLTSGDVANVGSVLMTPDEKP